MLKLVSIVSVACICFCCWAVNKQEEKAEHLFKEGKFGACRELCEKILVDDPHNLKAINLVAKIYKKKTRSNEVCIGIGQTVPYFPGLNSYTLDTVNDTWLLNYKPSKAQQEYLKKQEINRNRLKKFANILIVHKDVRSVSFDELISQTNEQARVSDPEKRKVKIIYNGPKISRKITTNVPEISFPDMVAFMSRSFGLWIEVEDNKVILSKSEDLK